MVRIEGNGNNNVLVGTPNQDSIFGFGGNDRLFAGKANDTLSGGVGNDSLFGGFGSDTLSGGAGNDILEVGFWSVGNTDSLTGGTGRDQFIVGNATQVFYDNGNPNTAGTNDYALITDFNANEDVIQLRGPRSNYRLSASPSGSPQGTAIYLNKPTGQPDELIGIIQGSAGLSLNSNDFRFRFALNLSSLNGSDGFVLNGVDEYDSSGISVSSAGDVNGDGFDDLIVGASGVGPSNRYGNNTGESYVVFGKAGGFGTSLNLANLNGRNGFVLNRIDEYGSLGNSVSSAGDVNGDGFDDLIVGAVTSQYYDGESYVVFGKARGFAANLNLANLNGSNGFILRGIDGGDRLGSSVSSAGDVNGDGFDDLIVGASGADPNGQPRAGESYVVFGKAGGFSANLNLASLNGSNGFVLQGIGEGDYSGGSVSSAGDVNGDGFDDLIVGASGADSNGQPRAGESYVVFGKAGGFSANLNLASLNGSNGFVLQGIDNSDYSGGSVSSAGDVNGDGFDDLIVGADETEPNGQVYAGESYVVFGKAGGFSANLNLASLNGSNGFVLQGIDQRDYSGGSVSSAGDVNGDGFDDLIVGAYRADSNGQSYAGESYVVFGKAGGFAASLNLANLNGSNGFVLNGIDEYDFSGFSVSSAGDVDGDGFDDLIVGAPGADPNGQSFAGESYVVFGRDFTAQVTRPGTVGNDLLTGTSRDDILIGGLGSDTLLGGRGTDVLLGGGGNDILAFGPIDRRLNGGSGSDTLRVDISGVNLDLSTPASNQLMNFEIIDLTGKGNNSLSFRRRDLLDLSDTTNRLIVQGNRGDRVTSTGQGWLLGGTTTLAGVEYNRYTAGAAGLLVEVTLSQTLS